MAKREGEPPSRFVAFKGEIRYRSWNSRSMISRRVFGASLCRQRFSVRVGRLVSTKRPPNVAGLVDFSISRDHEQKQRFITEEDTMWTIIEKQPFLRYTDFIVNILVFPG